MRVCLLVCVCVCVCVRTCVRACVMLLPSSFLPDLARCFHATPNSTVFSAVILNKGSMTIIDMVINTATLASVFS